MHLGLVCSEYPPAPHGGIGSFSVDLAEGLVQAGHRVTVLGIYSAAKSFTRENRNGVQVIRMPSARSIPFYRPREHWDRWQLKRQLLAEHARNPFDVVEVPDYDGWLPKFDATRPWPIIARLHGSNLFFDSELKRTGQEFLHELERRTLRTADSWVGVSQYAFDRTLQFCGLEQYPGTLIYHGVDTNLFSPGTDPMERGLIVFVNTVNAKKGVEELVEAANLILPNHPERRMVLIGGAAAASPRQTPYPEQLLTRVKGELRSRVIFTGRLERQAIIPWLRKANVCVYPSRMETFGIAPVEAMAVGRPTIYSRTGPGPEIIEDGVSGLLCDPFDSGDIAAKIGRILDEPSFGQQLGAAARRRVLAQFDRKNWIPKNVEYFSKCIAEKQANRR